MKFRIVRCLLPAFLLVIILTSFKSSNKFAEDFLEFWTDVNDNYAYFGKKHTDWNKVKTVYLPKAESAKNENELITVFENALEELYDHHFSLNTNLNSSTRLVPTGVDLWAEWVNDKAIVTDVRSGFSASKAGIRCGMEIVSINGIPVAEAVKNRTGKCLTSIDADCKNYALMQLLAGTYLTKRVLVINIRGKQTTFHPDEPAGEPANIHKSTPLLESRILPNNIGYIKFNNSLGQTAVIRLFDSLLYQLKNTASLVIDLRETPSGGNTVVARGILGRFTSTEVPYQKHVMPSDEKEYKIRRSWIELVSPRGEFCYDKPVVVLVNHWTGSMGEGITIGFDAIKKTSSVGSKMAGLNGAITGFSTSRCKIPYSFPTEQLYHINGTPREFFKPTNFVDLSDEKYMDTEDPILTEAILLIHTKR
jgi:carboxyl-terminal processing protease